MMSVPAEGAERLAEILREIFALSEPNRPNRSKSTAADEPIEIRVYDEAGNVIETHEHAGGFQSVVILVFFERPSHDAHVHNSR